MKKITCSLIALLLLGCGNGDNAQCRKIKNVKWVNREQTIKIYQDCIGDVKDNLSVSDDQIDSMPYLSYIYLVDDAHHDLDTAKKLIQSASDAIWAKCKYAADNDVHMERYNNYCFVKETGWAEFKPIQTFYDAVIVYQMTLPCVHFDMVRENEKALGIIESYFGSTRDLSIPAICDKFDGDKFIELSAFFDNDASEYLYSINPADAIDGTIRFGIRTSKYHDLVYMLSHPAGFFKSDNLADISVAKFDSDTKVSAIEMETEIYKNKSAARGYENLISALRKYYTTALKMDAADAEKYAHMAAAELMLQDLYINTTRY